MNEDELTIFSLGRVELVCYTEKVRRKMGNTAAGINAVNNGLGLCPSH